MSRPKIKNRSAKNESRADERQSKINHATDPPCAIRRSQLLDLYPKALEIQPRVGVIILAAGASARFGEPKQLLKFQNQTLLRRAAQTALDSKARPIVVVIGANAELMREELRSMPVALIENVVWQTGLASSLCVGLEALCALNERIRGAIVMLCDQPRIGAAHLNRLIAEYERGGALIVASQYAETHGAPALFDRALFAELMALRGEAGAKRIITEHMNQVRGVGLEAGAIDIDTQADYRKLITE